MQKWWCASTIAVAIAAMVPAAAQAGEVPINRPSPDWITIAPLPAAPAAENDGLSLLVMDAQQRFDGGEAWSYSDNAVKVASPEVLGQLATIALQWSPDKGDLIVHEVSILRGTEKIDLITSGPGFVVLRREENLEQRQLSGSLTATMAPQGLRVGDILRVRYSTTAKDTALSGRVQSALGLAAAPMRAGFGRIRVIWPSAENVHWQALAEGVTAKPATHGGVTELVQTLPLPKQTEMPGDAPMRFRHSPLIEFSSFADWADVSKVMAPLYATDGLIADGSALAQEADRIAATEATPIGRAQAALQLVQDKVRYLAVFMNGGNYVPQKPVETWSLRYGDCKAKTLLLLSLLRRLGVEAEPVLASSQLGDLVAQRLPSAAAFDHVLVRAVIGGESLWLDGTASGDRMEDIRDTPPFRSVLPLRMAGSGLIPIATHPDGRAAVEMLVNADESTSPDLPSVYDATIVLRGQPASAVSLMLGRIDASQQTEFARGLLTKFFGEGQFNGVAITADAKAASATIKAHGITSTPWSWDERQMRRSLGMIAKDFNFEPNRAKTEWSAVPVATGDPFGVRYQLNLRLPAQGRGYSIEAGDAVAQDVAGSHAVRTIKLDGGLLTVEERLDTTGGEIPVSQIAAERDKAELFKSRVPRLIAPPGVLRLWNLPATDPAGSTQLAAARAAYAKVIAEDPKQATAWQARANFLAGIHDRKGAVADLDKAIAIAPDKNLLLQRAGLYVQLGNLPAALADAAKARELDPSDPETNGVLARMRAENGDLAGAITLLDSRIALGGDNRDAYREAKAGLIGEFGDPAQALAILDTMLAEKPGRPSLLNSRCWVKGTRSVAVDSALPDCTRAIELMSQSFAALDSRSVVWFRQGRFADALTDLDAVLAQVPGLAASRFMRGVVLGRLGRKPEAAADLAIARAIDPVVEKTYARFGITP